MTDRYGIIGYPLKHSLSPFMHSRYAYYLNADETYEPFEVLPGRLDVFMKQCHRNHILGLNITIPYKEEIIPYLHSLDKGADIIGAVNTLKYTEEGYIGFNTDAAGLSLSLKKAGISLKNKNVLILGAGGAARAAAFVSSREGCSSISVLNRTYSHAEKLSEAFDAFPCSYEQITELDKESYVAIQTTNVGMYPDIESILPLPEELIRRFSAAVEVIYNPVETVFFRTVSSEGIPVINGFDMLINQGLASRSVWKPDEIIPEETEKKVYDECLNYQWPQS